MAIISPNSGPKKVVQEEPATLQEKVVHEGKTPQGKSITQIDSHHSETANKVDDLFKSFLSTLSNFVTPLKNKVSSYFSTLNWQLKEIIGKVFPNQNRKRANEIGVGKFQGEEVTNYKRVAGGTSLDTVLEELKNKRDMVKINPLDPFRSMYQIPQQFQKDLNRGVYKLDGEEIYNTSDHGTGQEVQRESAIYNACDTLIQRFQFQGFTNIARLLTQTVQADLIEYFIKNPNFSVFAKNEADYGLYEIKEENNQVHLIINQLFKIRDKESEDPEQQLGFITVQRDIIISKKALQKDWTQPEASSDIPESEREPPGIEVIDRYSPFCQTKQAAASYYDKFTQV